MDKPFIYRVTETNVDGCGGDATEFVTFEHKLCDYELSTELPLFRACLQEAKAVSEDMDTSEIIADALRLFEHRTGIHGELTEAPYEGAIEF